MENNIYNTEPQVLSLAVMVTVYILLSIPLVRLLINHIIHFLINLEDLQMEQGMELLIKIYLNSGGMFQLLYYLLKIISSEELGFGLLKSTKTEYFLPIPLMAIIRTSFQMQMRIIPIVSLQDGCF